MRRSSFDEHRDLSTANAVGNDKDLMCMAQGCPNRWTSDYQGKLCRWHAEAEHHLWPQITEEMNWHVTERAQQRGMPAIETEPLSFEQKKAILARLADLPRHWAAIGPKAWAYRLRDREMAGEQLRSNQKTMWRAALGHESEPA